MNTTDTRIAIYRASQKHNTPPPVADTQTDYWYGSADTEKVARFLRLLRDLMFFFFGFFGAGMLTLIGVAIWRALHH